MSTHLKDFVFLQKMSKTNTREEKVALFKRLNEFLDTNDQAICEEVFAQDHRMIIPGTGGKESKEFPVPPGIEGSTLDNLLPDSLGPKTFVNSLHKGFSDIKWEMQKLIFEEDGGEDLVAGRTEWSGISFDMGEKVNYRGPYGRVYGDSAYGKESCC